MTLTQAQQLVDASGGRSYQTGGTADAGGGINLGDPGSGGSSGGGGTGPIQGPDFAGEGGYQTDMPTGYVPIVGWPGYFYNPDTGDIRIATNFTNGATDANGNVGTPSMTTRSLSKAEKANFLAQYDQWLQSTGQSPGGAGSASGGGSGGGGGANAAQQLAYDYATLAEKQNEFNKTFGLNQEQQRQSEVQNRASTGLNLGDFVRNLSNDVYNRAADPGNFPAYLAAMSGLPQGSGSPISSLLGQGIQIQSPSGSNPLADPRFASLLDQLYGYAQPQNLSTVQQIAQANGGTLPQSFYDYTHTTNPNAPASPSTAPAYAAGGTQMLNEPVIGIGLHSGQPKFLAGEAGQEKLTFQPVHNHSNGGMPVPHSHAMGDQQHQHNADGSMAQDMRKYADGGTAQTPDAYGGANGPFTPHQLISAYNAYHPDAPMADTTYTPAEASAISLGKALQPLGYAPRALIDELNAGRAPLPGALNEQFMARLPTSLRLLLGATVKSFVGNSGLQDFNDAMQQYAMPGQSGYTQTAYL